MNDDVADKEAIAPVPGAPDFKKATKEKNKCDDYENKIAEVGLLSNHDDKIVLTRERSRFSKFVAGSLTMLNQKLDLIVTRTTRIST